MVLLIYLIKILGPYAIASVPCVYPFIDGLFNSLNPWRPHLVADANYYRLEGERGLILCLYSPATTISLLVQ